MIPASPPASLPIPAATGLSTLTRIWVLFITLAGLALRLQALARQPIWWDEARNIDVALRPFLSIANAPELDIHPPVYFWLLHGWSKLLALQTDIAPADLAYSTRLLSVLAGVLGIVLLYRLGEQIDSPAAGAVAATIGAFSPFWLAEGQETRMYTIGFVWLLAAAVAFLSAWRREGAIPGTGRQADWVRLAAFVILCAAALLTHYSALFIVVAWYLWWGGATMLTPSRWHGLRAVMLCGLAMTLLLLPIAPIALRQIPGYANPNLVVPTLSDYLAQNWRAYVGGYAYDPALGNGLAPMWLWLVLVVGTVGIVAVWLRQRHIRPALGFVASWLILGLALYYIAVLDRGAFNVRYSSFVTPALYLTLGIAVAGWGRWWRPLIGVALVAVVALWPQAIYADLYDARYNREDIASVTRWLREQAGPNDVIFVDQKYPFGFYYDRYAIEPEIMPMGDEAAPARYLFVDINTIDVRLNEWAADAEQVFWVQWFESDTDPRRAVAFLLDQAGERMGEQAFQGYSIDSWRLNPPNSFALAPNLMPQEIVFPPALRTVAISAPQAPVPVGGDLPVVIRWQRVAGGEVSQPLKARVALYDANGARLAQRDERLLNDRHLLPTEWGPDDQPLNVYLLELPADLPAGEYSLGLLVYDADTLEPLGVLDAAGNPAGVETIFATVAVVP